jgi:dTDP-4-amino-4,6-dideoxygalactose transaminase
MSVAALAINGGNKVRTKPFPPYRIIGEEERGAAVRVIESGMLSRFLGTWHKDFYGGPEVQALEREWAKHFGVKHAIAVNSGTSGLYCAIGVFADIEEDFFCLDPDSVEERITEQTKAIMVVDIFGLPYDVERINAIATKYGLIVIEDNAQAPAARFRGSWAGTLGDIGVFSLNYHKHIHCGEGGMVVTDDDSLAEKVRLIRNHAEAVLHAKGENTPSELINMIGFNFRMTEIEAAIAREQLKKLDMLVADRVRNVEYLAERLARIPGITPAAVRPGCTHSYYVHALKYDEEETGIPRNRFIEAVKAELPHTELREGEGVLIGCGYVKPLYLQPLYQHRIAYGEKGCPFTCSYYQGTVDYTEGICPVTERMHFRELVTHELMRPPLTDQDLDDIHAAFQKVFDGRSEIP